MPFRGRSCLPWLTLCLRRSPKSKALLPGLPLVAAELVHAREGEDDVSVAVALLDGLRVDEGPIFQVHVPEQPTVFVSVLVPDLVAQDNFLAFNEIPGELGGFLAEELDRLAGIYGLGRVDADEADLFNGCGDADLDRVAVEYARAHRLFFIGE